jgi:hypothetical protein
MSPARLARSVATSLVTGLVATMLTGLVPGAPAGAGEPEFSATCTIGDLPNTLTLWLDLDVTAPAEAEPGASSEITYVWRAWILEEQIAKLAGVPVKKFKLGTTTARVEVGGAGTGDIAETFDVDTWIYPEDTKTYEFEFGPFPQNGSGAFHVADDAANGDQVTFGPGKIEIDSHIEFGGGFIAWSGGYTLTCSVDEPLTVATSTVVTDEPEPGPDPVDPDGPGDLAGCDDEEHPLDDGCELPDDLAGCPDDHPTEGCLDPTGQDDLAGCDVDDPTGCELDDGTDDPVDGGEQGGDDDGGKDPSQPTGGTSVAAEAITREPTFAG